MPIRHPKRCERPADALPGQPVFEVRVFDHVDRIIVSNEIVAGDYRYGNAARTMRKIASKTALRSLPCRTLVAFMAQS